MLIKLFPIPVKLVAFDQSMNSMNNTLKVHSNCNHLFFCSTHFSFLYTGAKLKCHVEGFIMQLSCDSNSLLPLNKNKNTYWFALFSGWSLVSWGSVTCLNSRKYINDVNKAREKMNLIPFSAIKGLSTECSKFLFFNLYNGDCISMVEFFLHNVMMRYY